MALLHEDAESDYLNISEAINRDYAEALGQARAEGSSGRFYGFDVYMNQKIAVATAICKNLFFHRDAFVFVTAEYNHGVPGAFKNAYDSIGPEWANKAVGFVSYGSVSGSRAVEQWRQIVATFGMIDVAPQVAMSTFTEFDKNGEFAPNDRHVKELDALLDEVVSRASKLG